MFQPEIEGLRAIAVVSVLLYHAHLGPFHGGYVGVDVFFVVSGFLITRILVDEIGRTGTLALPAFWARRARRLLPASALVIATTVAVSRWVVDPLTQGFVDRSAVAAVGFVANVLFWTRGGYSHLSVPEPLLHFWSLALEEQFYLIWPLILWALSRSRVGFRRSMPWVVAGLGTGSLLAGVILSRTQQPLAFYLLPTRAWELLAGAALVLATPKSARAPTIVRAGAAWVGLLGVAFSVVTFTDPELGFPGARALLPVAATALVVFATATGSGTTAHQWSPVRLLRGRSMVWIGKRSYSLYLWHFPLLVLAAARWGPLSAFQRMLILAVSVVVAAVTFANVEDPVRRSRWLTRRPARSLLLGAGLATTGLLVIALVMRTIPSTDTGVVAAAPVLVTSPTPGAAPPLAAAVSVPATSISAPATSATSATSARTDPVTMTATVPVTSVPTTSAAPPETTPPVAATGTTWAPNPDGLLSLEAANLQTLEAAAMNEFLPSNLRPGLHGAYADKPAIYGDGCILGDGNVEPKNCVFGDPSGAVSVVLFGDSHMAQWFDAMDGAARANGWRLIVLTKMGCPTADVPVTNPARASQCGPWRDRVMSRIGEIHPDLVILSAYRYQGSDDASWESGLDQTLTVLRPLAARVLIMGDTPTPRLDVPSCVAGHPHNLSSCANSRDAAMRPGRLSAEYGVAQAHDADFITTDDWLCTATSCPVVIGDVLVYRDDSHLTTTAAALFTPYVEAMIRPLLPST